MAHNNFLLSKMKPNPKAVEINVTEKCCLKCIMCNIWTKKSTNELTTDEIKMILDQLKKEGFTTVTFAGGEPLIRSDIFNIINYAKKLNFKINLITNGYLVNEDIAEKLCENGVLSVSVSLDAIEEKYDEIRGVPGAYKKVLKAIEIFSKLRKEKKLKSLSISITLMKPTLNSVHEIINIGIRLGIPVKFNLLDYTPYFFQNVTMQKDQLWIEDDSILKKLINEISDIKRKNDNLIAESYTSLIYIKNYFQNPIRKDIPCYKILKNIKINPQGKVYPCWSVPYIGDLRNEKLYEILHSKKYIYVTKKLFLKNCPGCTCSFETDLIFNIPNLIQEIQFNIKNLIK